MTPIDLEALRLAQKHVADQCIGSGSIVHIERTDGNKVTACPQCHRFRVTYPGPDDEHRTVEVHPTLWVDRP